MLRNIYIASPLIVSDELKYMTFLRERISQFKNVTVSGQWDAFGYSVIAFLGDISPDAQARIDDIIRPSTHVLIVLKGVSTDVLTNYAFNFAVNNGKELWVLQTAPGGAPYYVPSHPFEVRCDKLFIHSGNPSDDLPNALLAALAE